MRVIPNKPYQTKPNEVQCWIYSWNLIYNNFCLGTFFWFIAYFESYSKPNHTKPNQTRGSVKFVIEIWFITTFVLAHYLIYSLFWELFQTKPCQTIPNQLKHWWGIQKLISCNFYPWCFLDRVPHFREIVHFCRRSQKKKQYFGHFMAKNGRNIKFKTSIQIYTNFPITFVFWRKKSEGGPKKILAPQVKPFWKPSFFFLLTWGSSDLGP